MPRPDRFYSNHASRQGTGDNIYIKGLTPARRRIAQVAQLVEQRTENPRVGGSIPPLGTIIPKKIVNLIIKLYS